MSRHKKKDKQGLYGSEWTTYYKSQKLINSSEDHSSQKLLADFKDLSNNYYKLLQQAEHTTYQMDTQQKEIQEANIQIKEYSQTLKQSQEKVMSSIQFAYLIQVALLPDIHQIEKSLRDFFVIWQPRDIVGGDFFTFQKTRDGCLLGIIDCTGHGVYGALMTMTVRAILEDITSQFDPTNPAEILGEWNRRIRNIFTKDEGSQHEDAGLDACLLYYDFKKREVIYSTAGVLVFGNDGNEIIALPVERRSIGYRRSNPKHSYENIKVTRADAKELYITTDGYVDQFSPELDMSLGKKTFMKYLHKSAGKDSYQQVGNLLYRLYSYQGDLEQTDDITVAGFKL